MPAYIELGLVFSLGLVLASIYLLARRKISPRLFLSWLLVGGGLGLVFGVPALLSVLQTLLGTQFVLSAAVFAGFIIAISMIFYQQWKVSDSETQIRTLATEIALLKYSVDKLKLPEEHRKTQ